MNRRLSNVIAISVSVFSLGALVLGPNTGCASSSSQKPQAVPNAAPTGSYAFWPMAPDEPRIQFIKSLRSSNDLSPTKTSGLEQAVFGKEAESAADINKPFGVAMHDGKVYVCDMRASSLVVFDFKKKQTRLVGTSGVNRLDHPVAAAVSEDGFIYVADNNRGAVIVFDASERYTETYGFPNFKPVSVAVHGDRLYATDVTSQTVQIFNRKTGEKLGVIGSVGDADGQFRVPLGVACDPKGNVWVVDVMRCRVQKFSPEGQFISAMGELGDYAGSFARPKHIAIDGDGIVYIVDAAFQNVQMFDDQMRLLMSFGAAGNFPGSMNLPAGVATCDDSNDIFKDQLHPGFKIKRVVVVTNQFGGDKVSLYAMGERREGYTVQALASASVPVSAGVGSNKEHLKLQDVGSQEPSPAPEAPAAPDVAAPAAPSPTK